jgi:hypothetical protein
VSTATKIMVIRHAEKPTDADQGVSPSGTDDKRELIIQGWQRAGALACLFAPARGALQSSALATPQFLFASDDSSQRPKETITPLAERLNLKIDLDFGKGQESELVQAAKAKSGTVLISWQHEAIPAIGNAVVGNNTTVPQKWPGNRFDVVWIFDLNQASGKYEFTQVPQCLLAGDENSVIPRSASAQG